MPNILTKSVEKGWHGSETTIKVSPRDFMRNDDDARANLSLVDAAAGSAHRMFVSGSNLEMYAHVIVPQGYKATAYKVFGSDATNRCLSFEACVAGCLMIALQNPGVYVVGSTHTLDTEMVAGATNYLLLKVTPTATDDYIYGATVTIEKV